MGCCDELKLKMLVEAVPTSNACNICGNEGHPGLKMSQQTAQYQSGDNRLTKCVRPFFLFLLVCENSPEARTEKLRFRTTHELEKVE